MKFKENQWSNAKKAVERVFCKKKKKNHEVAIVPHNLKKNYSRLIFLVTKLLSLLFSEKYNTWMANEVSNVE